MNTGVQGLRALGFFLYDQGSKRQRAGRTTMFSGIEIFYNLLYLSMIVAGVAITFYIMKSRDPHDDGPSVDDDEDSVDEGRL